MKILSPGNHLPGIRSPRVRILQKKIRSKAGIYNFSRWNFISPISIFLNWQIKFPVFTYGIWQPSISAVHSEYITMAAALTNLVTSVPWVPTSQNTAPFHKNVFSFRFMIQ